MQTRRKMTLMLAALAAGIPVLRASAVLADPAPSNGPPSEFSSNELIANGHRFFGSASRGLAEIVEAATRRWGKPNGYVLGQEAGGGSAAPGAASQTLAAAPPIQSRPNAGA